MMEPPLLGLRFNHGHVTIVGTLYIRPIIGMTSSETLANLLQQVKKKNKQRCIELKMTEFERITSLVQFCLREYLPSNNSGSPRA
jgi:hypothetical protein